LNFKVAFEVLQEHPHIGFNKLLEWLDMPQHPTKQAMHHAMDANDDLWAHRPLDKNALHYAAMDVKLLIDAYPELLRRLGGSLNNVVAASSDRARSGAANQGRRRIAFDLAAQYKLRSAEVMEKFFHDRIAPRLVCGLNPV